MQKQVTVFFKKIFFKNRIIVVLSSIIVVCSLSFHCKKEELGIPESIKFLITNNENCTCNPFIDKYEWRNKIVYLYSCNGPTCNCVTWYYDATGTQFTMDTGYTPDDFKAESKFLGNVWTCK